MGIVDPSSAPTGNWGSRTVCRERGCYPLPGRGATSVLGRGLQLVRRALHQ